MVALSAPLDYVILRVHNIYGSHMDFAPGRATFIGRVIAAVRSVACFQIRGMQSGKCTLTCPWDVLTLF